MPRDAATPTDYLYRIGRAPDPLAFPPNDRTGNGRFDAPGAGVQYRVLYTGDRLATFYKTLAQFRVKRLLGAAAQGLTADWFHRYRIGSIVFGSSSTLRWLDLTDPATYSDFDNEFSALLDAKGLEAFDVSVVTSKDLELTQHIGSWAYRNGYNGIKYVCRHHPGLRCWAIFEGSPFEIIDGGSKIDLDDYCLTQVVADWALPLPSAM
jgi:hypothetical protein